MTETKGPRKVPPRAPTYDDALIARLCERVYRIRLEGDAEKMIAEDADDGTKLRRRAMSYAPIIKVTLDALALEQAA